MNEKDKLIITKYFKKPENRLKVLNQCHSEIDSHTFICHFISHYINLNLNIDNVVLDGDLIKSKHKDSLKFFNLKLHELIPELIHPSKLHYTELQKKGFDYKSIEHSNSWGYLLALHYFNDDNDDNDLMEIKLKARKLHIQKAIDSIKSKYNL